MKNYIRSITIIMLILKAILHIKKSVDLINSIRAFLLLTEAGFKISHYESNILGMYKFWWKDKRIDDFPDIDIVDGKHYTVNKGRSKPLL